MSFCSASLTVCAKTRITLSDNVAAMSCESLVLLRFKNIYTTGFLVELQSYTREYEE